MKSYEEIADRILEKYENYIKEEKNSSDKKSETEEFADILEYTEVERISRPQRIKMAIFQSSIALIGVAASVFMIKYINLPPMIDNDSPNVVDSTELPDSNSIIVTTADKDNVLLTEIPNFTTKTKSEESEEIQSNAEQVVSESEDVLYVESEKKVSVNDEVSVSTAIQSTSVTSEAGDVTTATAAINEYHDNENPTDLSGYEECGGAGRLFEILGNVQLEDVFIYDGKYEWLDYLFSSYNQLYVNDKATEFVVVCKLDAVITIELAEGVTEEQVVDELEKMDFRDEFGKKYEYIIICLADDRYLFEYTQLFDKNSTGAADISDVDVDRFCSALKGLGLIKGMKTYSDITSYMHFYSSNIFRYDLSYETNVEDYLINRRGVSADFKRCGDVFEVIIKDDISGSSKSRIAYYLAQNIASPCIEFDTKSDITFIETDVYSECDTEFGSNKS